MNRYLLYITFLLISTPILRAADWRKCLTKKVYASQEERQQVLDLQEKRKAEYKIWKETTYFCELCNLTLKQKGNGRIESHKAREHGICYYCDYKNDDRLTMVSHVHHHLLNTHKPELKKHAVNEE